MNENEPRKQYDAATGLMISTEQSMKAAHERALYEFREWYNSKAAPPEGYGIDGYPLMKVGSGKLRVERTEGDGCSLLGQ